MATKIKIETRDDAAAALRAESVRLGVPLDVILHPSNIQKYHRKSKVIQAVAIWVQENRLHKRNK